MNTDFLLPVRPEISLLGILGYMLFAFAFTLAFTPAFVSFLLRNKVGKQLRVETVDGRDPTIFRTFHQSKSGTPTMGGVIIWASIFLTVFVSRVLAYFGVVEHSLLQRGQVYLPLFVLLALGLLGGLDDYLNIKGVGKKRGLNAIPKLTFLLLIALLGALWFYFRLGYDYIHVPYIGNVTVGLWYIPIFIFIVSGTANAVNFTDGLDGLAGGLLAIAFSAFGVLAYTEGLFVLAAFCGVCVGAIAAFLWHNVPPALFFMGDTGSLALGGTLAVMAMMIDQALILPLAGFVFVIEMLSVIIQLTSKRLRGGKKVFLAAPIHHHFEALGWGESKVTMRLWIIGAFMAFLGIIVGLAG
jgi:phospho-N-acetylmuramoyl-pentapeptide-transferase